MAIDPPALPSSVVAASTSRHIAAAIDGVAAIAVFLGLYFGLMQLGSLIGDANGLLSGVLWVGPCFFWLAVLLTLAWGGQTPGLALLRLRWVDQHGATARWRPAGEPRFWCLALAGLVLLAPYLVMAVWVAMDRLIWAVAHVSIRLPGSEAIAPGAAVTVLVMLGLGWLARRRPAALARAGAR